MNTLDKISQAVGMLAAPVACALSHVTKKTWLAHTALKMDPLYHRAFQTSALDGDAKAQIARLQVASMLTAKVTPEARQLILKLLAKSRAQFLQDIFCALASDLARDGFFVEVGVGSGERISNTYMLEKEFNWTGLLFEPNRTFHDSIRASRTAKLDIRAASSKTGEKVKFEEFTGAGEFSRLVGAKSHDMSKSAAKKYDVDTITLTDAFAENKAPSEIDFISIDTEGSEIDVLNGIDFKKYHFRIMVIEHNYHQKAKNAYEEILNPHGYRRILPEASSADAWYVHRDVPLASFQGV